MRRIRVILEMQSLLKDAETIYYYHKDAKKAITLGDRAIALYEQNVRELEGVPVVKELYKHILNFTGNIWLDLKDERFRPYVEKFYELC